jgi:PEP-CTERM motif-containing protein
MNRRAITKPKPACHLTAVPSQSRARSANIPIGTFVPGEIDVVPEPSSAILMLGGLAWLYARRRRAAKDTK